MFITEYGKFDGNSWENTCQICFKQKYGDEYREMKASPGDFGIEGFTSSGKVFQCYSPDENYDPKELFEKQRDKITKDLKKLIDYETELKKYLGDIKIKQWIFVTPKIGTHELVRHCTAKTAEYRVSSTLCTILDTSIEVTAQDIQFLLPHLKIALSDVSPKIDFTGSTTDEDKINYQNTQGDLVLNSINKHTQRFDGVATTNVAKKVDEFTDRTIRHFLDGKQILDNWVEVFPNDYERFLRLVSQIEEGVTDICAFPTNDNNGRYREIQQMVETKIRDNFSGISEPMIVDLSNHVIADWILRCPINFV